MRVLYLCHRVPYPPDKGDKIRAFHQLRAIGERHEVDLFTLADTPGDTGQTSALRNHCARVTVVELPPALAGCRALPYLFTRVPLTLPYFYSRALSRQILEALRNNRYDRIFVFCSSMMQYILEGPAIPTVLDLVDVDSDKWVQYAERCGFPLSAIYGREGKRLREFERRACRAAAEVVVTTEREARLARQIAPGASLQVIPNGVDTEYFQPQGAGPEAAGPVIVFVGDMRYFPNVDAVQFFAGQVFPSIRNAVPQARFLIVGRNPGTAVKRLARTPGIEVTGAVPDVRPWLAKSRVAVAPFRIATGIQNKIVEAMASALPVIATSRAAQGLPGPLAARVTIADTPDEFAAQVLLPLKEPRRARIEGAAGRRTVEAEYTWQRGLDRLLEVLEFAGRSAATV